MITDTAVDAYNQRLTATLGTIEHLVPSQRDQVQRHGDRAEALLGNADLVMFIHEYRFSVMDALAAITGHDPDSNARRIALANQLSGMDNFIAVLQRAVYMRNRVVKPEDGPRDSPRAPTKEVYKP